MSLNKLRLLLIGMLIFLSGGLDTTYAAEETQLTQIHPTEVQPKEAQPRETQPKETQPIIVDGDTVEYATEDNLVTAQGNVVVTYQDSRLTCDKIVLDTQTKDSEAFGNIRLENPRGILEAEKLIYNFNTNTGDIRQATYRTSPYYHYGEEIKPMGKDLYIVRGGHFSSCNYDHPHFRIKPKESKVYPGDKIIARSNRFYWLHFPFFYFPVYSHNLKESFWKVQMQPGKTSDWGSYLLTALGCQATEKIKLRLYLDWRDRWGTAQGFGLNYDTKKVGRGDFKFYYTNERRTNEDEAYKQEFQRYMARLRHQWKIDANTDLTLQYYAIRDNRRGVHTNDNFLSDYFYEEYTADEQPKSYILINRSFQNPGSTISFMGQYRTNRWYSAMNEKLPEITYDLPTYKLGQSPFYLTNKTILSNLTRKNPHPSNVDNDVVRFDTDNKLTLPAKIMFIAISPYVGLRETYYTKDDQGAHLSPRTVFSSGIDASTKFYRMFNVKSNFLGLDINNLRHIISPKIEYGYRHEPTISPSKLQQFDDLDSIDGDNRFTLSLENALQTKRDNKVWHLGTLEISSDYIMYSKASSYTTGQDRFTDINFDLELIPYAWLRMAADAAYNHRDDYWSSANSDIWFNFAKERSFSIGNRYIRGRRNLETTAQLLWRINPKWMCRFYGRYDFQRENGGMREWEFSVIRDLHCAVIEFSYNKRKKAESKNDISFWVGFHLKIFRESEFDYAKAYNTPSVSH